MICYRIYTRPNGQPDAKPRLADTHYNETEAAANAGRMALKGLWVKITQKEEAEPSRWD